jgi:hypothetical protein
MFVTFLKFLLLCPIGMFTASKSILLLKHPMAHPMTRENQRCAPLKSVAVSGSESASAFLNRLTIARPDTDAEADGLIISSVFDKEF